MKLMKSLIAASVAVVGTFAGVNAEDIAVVGGKAHTMGKAGIIDNATILIKDGKITSVTAGGDVPAGYRVVDAKGKNVTPGLMNPVSILGLNEVPSQSDNMDATFKKGKNSMALDVTWALNPDSVRIPIARIEGITRAGTGFYSAYPFSGQGAVIHLNGEDIVTRASSHMVLNVTDRAASSNGGSRAALWHTIMETMDKAHKAVKADKKPADSKGKKKKSKKKSKKAKTAKSAPKKLDANTKALVKVLKGEMLLVVSVHRKADILNVIKLKEKYGIKKMALAGASEAWRVADRLAKADINVIITTINNLPGSFERLGATLANAGRLSKAGVKVMFTGNAAGENIRLMPQQAGIAVANGMDWSEAMKAMTVYPAEAFGIAKSYGTLAAGMDADVVVWDGDPLEVMTSPDAVIIRGDQIKLESRQTKLRDRYQTISANPAFRK